jgi:hypothetical protein
MNVLIFFLGVGIGLLSALPNHRERPKPVVMNNNKGRAVPLYIRR